LFVFLIGPAQRFSVGRWELAGQLVEGMKYPVSLGKVSFLSLYFPFACPLVPCLVTSLFGFEGFLPPPVELVKHGLANRSRYRLFSVILF